MKSLLGIKMKQTQTFDQKGFRIPVTVIAAGPCQVASILRYPTKTNIQLAFGNKKSITKALAGTIKKAGLTIQPRFLREVTEKDDAPEVGSSITVDQVFAVGDVVSVTGVSKGHGFAGVVKRHGFRGMPRTHGTSDRERAPGSIGTTTTPGRVFRGKRMAGRMGSETVTIKGLRVIAVDAATNTLTVKGLVPGGVSGLLVIKKVN